MHESGNGNGDGNISAATLARWEAALESERRQREQMERRLRETERRLETALATVGAAPSGDDALLQLKSQLAAEMEVAKGRERLEHQLLEIELEVNARAEVKAQPRVVYTPRTIPVPPEIAAPRSRATPSAPKDFDEKLASAQMAIDAAEARATHNAFQVRKLTEELAYARAEQIRLSSEMRALRERMDDGIASIALQPPAPVQEITSRAATPPTPAPLREVEEFVAPAPMEPAAAEDDLAAALAGFGGADEAIVLEEPRAKSTAPSVDDDLAAALSDWGGADTAVGTEAAPVQESGNVAQNLEDALESFGGGDTAPQTAQNAAALDLEDALAAFSESAPAEPAPSQDSSDELEQALAAFADEVPTPARPVIDAPELGNSLEDALSTFGEDVQDPEAFAAGVDAHPQPPSEEDEMVAALEAWGETGGGCNTEVNLPREEASPLDEPVTQDWGSLLEVDTLKRLDTPDAPVEQRVAEALRSDAIHHESDGGEAALLEDIETAPMEEEAARWEPERAPAEDAEPAMLGGGLEESERYYSDIDADAGPKKDEEIHPEEDIEPEPAPDDFEAPHEISEEPADMEVDDRALREVVAERWMTEDEPDRPEHGEPEDAPPAAFPPDMDSPAEFPEDPAEDDREIPSDALRPAASLHEIAEVLDEEEAAEVAAEETVVSPTVSQGATLDALDWAAKSRERQPQRKLGKKSKSSRNAKVPVATAAPKRNVGPVVVSEVISSNRPSLGVAAGRQHKALAADAIIAVNTPPAIEADINVPTPETLAVAESSIAASREEAPPVQAREPEPLVEMPAPARQWVEEAEPALPAAPSPSAQLAAAEANDDFEPDLSNLMRRGAATRQAPADSARGGNNRQAMISALQRFIGE